MALLSREHLVQFSQTAAFYYVPALFAMVMVGVLSKNLNIPTAYFFRDPLSIAKLKPWVGVISNLGVLIWCSSLAICLFSYTLLRMRQHASEVTRFVLWGGLITFVLLLDDLFMFHEYLFSRIYGIDEEIVFSVYAGLLLLYFSIYSRFILQSNWLLLSFALMFFGLSILIDTFPSFIVVPWNNAIGGGTDYWLFLLEDGAKFLGIVGWLAYFASVCYKALIAEVKVESSET